MTTAMRSPAPTPPPTYSAARWRATTRQHGSLVDAGRLRFDFVHFSAIERTELAAGRRPPAGRAGSRMA
ncbi:hypothetical protein [Streptomyces sp. NPDC001880]